MSSQLLIIPSRLAYWLRKGIISLIGHIPSFPLWFFYASSISPLWQRFPMKIVAFTAVSSTIWCVVHGLAGLPYQTCDDHTPEEMPTKEEIWKQSHTNNFLRRKYLWISRAHFVIRDQLYVVAIGDYSRRLVVEFKLISSNLEADVWFLETALFFSSRNTQKILTWWSPAELVNFAAISSEFRSSLRMETNLLCAIWWWHAVSTTICILVPVQVCEFCKNPGFFMHAGSSTHMLFKMPKTQF